MTRRLRHALPLTLLSVLPGCSDETSSTPTPAPGDIVSTEVAANDFTFSLRTAGPEDGEVVLLLHGFPETSLEWTHQLSALGEAGYRVIAPDQRGYSAGARPEDIAEYEVTKLVGDVLAIADELGADTFHLVGHDWGAGVAWGVGALAPDRVRTLNILSIPHPSAFNAELEDQESCQYGASSYFDFFVSDGAEDLFLANDAAILRGVYEGLSDETIEAYVAFFSDRPALTGGLNWYRANIEDRAFATGDLPAITTQTMFIWSDGDAAICREPAEATAEFVSGPYRFEVLAGVNHWIPETAPDEVNALLLDHFGATP